MAAVTRTRDRFGESGVSVTVAAQGQSVSPVKRRESEAEVAPWSFGPENTRVSRSVSGDVCLTCVNLF